MGIEDFLAESGGFWKLLVESTQDLISVVDASGIVRYVTPSHVKLLGYSLDELIGKTLTALIHPDDLETAVTLFARALVENIPTSTNARNRHRDGHYIWLESSGTALFDDAGELMGGIIFSRDISARVEAEEALRESERRHRMLFQRSPAGVFYYDKDLRLTDCNERLISILRSSRERLIGLDLSTLRDQKVLPAIRQALRGEEGFYEGHYRAHTSDVEIWVTVRTSTLYDREGGIAGGMLVMEDITRLVEAESSLRVQRDLALRLAQTLFLKESMRLSLEAILETTGFEAGGVYLVDEMTGALDLIYHRGLSDEFIALVSRFEADSPNARLVMEGAPVYRKYDELFLLTNDVRGREGLRAMAVVPILHQGKVIGDVNISSRSLEEVPEKAKEIVETIAGQIGQAIARMRLDSALRESEERYRAVFEATGTAMCVVDFAARIIFLNREFLRLSGLSRQEADAGISLREVLDESGTNEIMTYLEKLKTGGEDRREHLLLRLTRVGGETREVLSSMGLLPGREACVLSLIDITLEREYERELEERAWQLREFLSVAAHEIRHPITLIMGYAETLGEEMGTGQPDSIREIILAIDASSRRLTHLAGELLDISRIEQGRFPIEVGQGHLDEILRVAVEEMRQRYGDREFSLQAGGECPLTLLDDERIHQLMVILLENAANFSEPATLVEVEVEWLERGVQVSVLDRGIGVPEEKRQRIFDRFFQVEDSAHHSTPGLGLGLFIAGCVVEAHGGSIWCEERQGGGSVFRFTLPVS
jgi:PAS domain S-box-containing protein